MGKVAIMLALAVLVSLGAIVWTKTSVSATGPAAATSLSGYDLHKQADTSNMPITDTSGSI
jgi:hypothetical protein